LSVIRALLFSLLRGWRKVRGEPPPYRVAFVDDLPERIDVQTVYLIGEGQYRWFAAMACPCGCGAAVQLSILPRGRPRWTVTQHWNGTVSLKPSIWRNVGCRSHYFVRRGRVEWIPPDPRGSAFALQSVGQEE